MGASLILAATFVPLVLVIVLLRLAFAWLRMRRANRDEVVDLVALQKEPQKPITTNDNYEGRKSTEPFPRLPSISLDDNSSFTNISYTKPIGKTYGKLQRITHNSTIPLVNSDHTSSNTLTTPPKPFSSLTESPSCEALAAFEFSDTPSKPPLPARSLKRASGSLYIPVSTTPTIEVESASPPSTSEVSVKDKIQPLRLSPTAIGRAHARQTIEAMEARNDEIKPVPALIPFSSVPITHIKNPTSDDLPPTPVRASTYLKQNFNQTPADPCVPKDAKDMQAMMANREMMGIEAWRPGLPKNLAAGKLGLSSQNTHGRGLTSKISGINMHGKRNSAIREYVRNFPEQNPWRRIVARRSRDVEAQQEHTEDEFMNRFGVGGFEEIAMREGVTEEGANRFK